MQRPSSRGFSPPASAPPPSPGPEKPGAGLEMVWDGPKPRMRRKLKMAPAAPLADFNVGHSRVRSTARRLAAHGLPTLQQPLVRAGTAPGFSARLSSASGGISGISGSSISGSCGPPVWESLAARTTTASSRWRVPSSAVRPPHTTSEEWLAERESAAVLTSRVRDIESYMKTSKEQMRKTQASLQAGRAVDMTRLHLQPQIELETVITGKPAPTLAEAAEIREAARMTPASRGGRNFLW